MLKVGYYWWYINFEGSYDRIYIKGFGWWYIRLKDRLIATILKVLVVVGGILNLKYHLVVSP